MPRRQDGPGRLQNLRRNPEATVLTGGQVGVTGRLEVRPQPGQAGVWRSLDGRRGCRYQVRIHAAAAEAGLDFEMDRQPRLVRGPRDEPPLDVVGRHGCGPSRLNVARQGGQCSRQERLVTRRDRDAVAPGRRCQLGRDREDYEDRHLHAGLPQLQRLVESGDAEAAGAVRYQGAGDGHGPVAIGVGLDDRL